MKTIQVLSLTTCSIEFNSKGQLKAVQSLHNELVADKQHDGAFSEALYIAIANKFNLKITYRNN